MELKTFYDRVIIIYGLEHKTEFFASRLVNANLFGGNYER